MELTRKRSLSIVIPAYNVEQWIEECLDSIAHQSWPNIECIIVDDNSTDNTYSTTQRLLHKYSSNGSNVNFILLHHDVNKGVSAARNTGLRAATGDYVWFVDPDDYIGQESVAILLQWLQKDADVIFFSYATFVQYTEQRKYRLKYCRQQKVSYKEFLLSTYLQGEQDGWSCLVMWNRLVRRDTLIKNDIWFDESLETCEDEDFQLRIAFIENIKIDINANCCYYKRDLRPGSFNSSKLNVLHGALQINEKYIDKSNSNDNWERKLFTNRAAFWIYNTLWLIANKRTCNTDETIAYIVQNKKRYSQLLINSEIQGYVKLGKILRISVKLGILYTKMTLTLPCRAIIFIKEKLQTHRRMQK